MQQVQNRITQHEFLPFPTRVRVVGPTYLVDLGPTTQPRFHTVDKHRRCSCELGAECPAIEAAAEYLPNGRQRAPDPMPPERFAARCFLNSVNPAKVNKRSVHSAMSFIRDIE